jgi:succinate dehydrogenase/fumarate reductase cytochrome b subunit
LDINECKTFVDKILGIVCHACNGFGHAALDWAGGKKSPFGGIKKPCPTQKALDAIIAAHVSFTVFREKFSAKWGQMLS